MNTRGTKWHECDGWVGVTRNPKTSKNHEFRLLQQSFKFSYYYWMLGLSFASGLAAAQIHFEASPEEKLKGSVGCPKFVGELLQYFNMFYGDIRCDCQIWVQNMVPICSNNPPCGYEIPQTEQHIPKRPQSKHTHAGCSLQIPTVSLRRCDLRDDPIWINIWQLQSQKIPLLRSMAFSLFGSTTVTGWFPVTRSLKRACTRCVGQTSFDPFCLSIFSNHVYSNSLTLYVTLRDYHQILSYFGKGTYPSESGCTVSVHRPVRPPMTESSLVSNQQVYGEACNYEPSTSN